MPPKKRHNRNYYKRWTVMEERYLMMERHRGTEWGEIALTLDRTTIAVQSQFQKVERREKEKQLAKVKKAAGLPE